MTAKHNKSAPLGAARHRPSWRGKLRFGLVSFDVEAINAEIKENAAPQFHLLHATDHERIRFVKVCPTHGEVPNDEIVEGYEVSKGRYVEFDKAELKDLKSNEERALVIDAFVRSDEIDPLYFDGRMYYLIPSGVSSSEPYALLAAAMEKKTRWGVGQIILSGREQLAIVRSMDGVLAMAMLNYDAEVRKPETIKEEIPQTQPNSRKQQLAEQLVEKWYDRGFDFSAYHDQYRQQLQDAIETKGKGVRAPTVKEPEPDVINLMDALQRSVAGPRRQFSKARRASSLRRRSTSSRRRRA